MLLVHDNIANEDAAARRMIDDNTMAMTKVRLYIILRGKGSGYAVVRRCLNKRTKLQVVDNISEIKVTYMTYC